MLSVKVCFKLRLSSLTNHIHLKVNDVKHDSLDTHRHAYAHIDTQHGRVLIFHVKSRLINCCHSTMDIDIDDIINDLREDSRRRDDYWDGEKSVARLKTAWINERMAPELLDFEADLLDKIMVKVRDQVLFIEEQSMNLQWGTDLKFTLLLVESELERIKFLVRGYLRTRLAKIDKYTVLINGNEGLLLKMSQSERSYMQRHFHILKELYKDQFLSNFPPSLQLLDDSSGGISMVEEPDLEKAVFIRVIEPVEHPITVGQDRVLLERGGIYVLRYSAVSRLLKSGVVELV